MRQSHRSSSRDKTDERSKKPSYLDDQNVRPVVPILRQIHEALLPHRRNRARENRGETDHRHASRRGLRHGDAAGDGQGKGVEVLRRGSFRGNARTGAAEGVPNAEFQRGSFYRLPYAEGSFDQVVATNALSGDAIDAGEALREMVRVCKTGGRIYIAEWPKTDDESITEKIVIWLASLNDDAPQDYFGMFREMGYEPEVDALDKRYHIFAIRK